ncbi:sulfotransferase [Jannaschia sp. W003]|uniref:sulfotransferase n=1 Tax=Jannaschia sp. W003 TaxID=2867012 RepID=UPI0021A90041|nr:sulfotransferase [Jannaschia sp. W003]UWQ21364.1 sulfotransferase [Jannaschia sp. W003]
MTADAATLRRLLDTGRPLLAMARAREAAADADPRTLQACARVALEVGAPAEAEAWLDRALEARPREAALWADRALAAHAADGARAFGRRVRDAGLPPAFAAALGELASGRGARAQGTGGLAPKALAGAQRRLDAGDWRGAEAALAGATPGAVPLGLLAEARLGRGDGAGGAQALQRAAAAEPWVAATRARLAEVAARVQGPAAALPQAAEAARLAPRLAAPAVLAARLALAARAPALARLASAALRLAPRDPHALRCAAEAALARDPRTALAHLRRMPENAPGRALLEARALAAAGEDEAALDAYGAILTEAPTDLAALTGRAQLLQSLGRAEPAETDLRAAIRAHPGAGLAMRALAYGTALAPDDPVLPVMRAALDGPEGRLAAYALARAEAPHAPEAAAAHLARANRLQSEAFPYDAEADAAGWARIAGPLWNALRDVPPSDSPARPVFVTGLPRSGTTLVEQVLAAHPALRAGGEMGVLQPALAPLYDAAEAGMAPPLRAAADAYVDAVERLRGPGRITDKSIHTFLHVGAVLRAMPQASVVVVRRDPRDTALSIWRNHFPDGTHRYAATWEGIAEHVALFEAALAHWRAALPEDAFHEIAYEDLLADPEGRARALLDACGLEWDADVLRFHERAGRVDTLSFEQVRAPMHAGRVGAWRRHAAELEPLVAALERRGVALPD